MSHPDDAAESVAELTEPSERLLGVMKAGETDDGHYYLVLRTWPHPDVDGAWTLALRYAYLTKGDGSDGWTEKGVNMRVEGSVTRFLQSLSRMFAGSIPRLDGEGEPTMHDATAEE